MNRATAEEKISHRFAGGLVVVARGCAQASPRTVLASAFNSLSLSPRLVMWCVPKSGDIDVRNEPGTVLGLSVLAVEHQDLCRGKTLADGLAKCVWLQGSSQGVPLLRGAAASFEVVVTQCTAHGDHYLYIGEVAAFTYCADSMGLLNYLDTVGIPRMAA